jgi:hypothetical protein
MGYGAPFVPTTKWVKGTYTGDDGINKEIDTSLSDIDFLCLFTDSSSEFMMTWIAGIDTGTTLVNLGSSNDTNAKYIGSGGLNLTGGKFYVDDQATNAHPNKLNETYAWIAFGTI